MDGLGWGDEGVGDEWDEGLNEADEAAALEPHLSLDEPVLVDRGAAGERRGLVRGFVRGLPPRVVVSIEEGGEMELERSRLTRASSLEVWC